MQLANICVNIAGSLVNYRSDAEFWCPAAAVRLWVDSSLSVPPLRMTATTLLQSFITNSLRNDSATVWQSTTTPSQPAF